MHRSSPSTSASYRHPLAFIRAAFMSGLILVSRRPRIERVPPRIQVSELVLDLLRPVQCRGNHGGGFSVEFRIRDRRAERPLLGLERLDARGQLVELAPLAIRSFFGGVARPGARPTGPLGNASGAAASGARCRSQSA